MDFRGVDSANPTFSYNSIIYSKKVQRFATEEKSFMELLLAISQFRIG